jgi:hypothetical protein
MCNDKLFKRIYRYTNKSDINSTLRDDECIIWNGACDPNGHPRISIKNKSTGVRRALWICMHGQISKNKFVISTCKNKKCVNLFHLVLSDSRHSQEKSKNKKQHLNIILQEDMMINLKKLSHKRNISMTRYVIKLIAQALYKETILD